MPFRYRQARRQDIFEQDEGKMIGRLHKLREDADYGVEQGYVVGEVQEELDNVRRFKHAVERVLLSLP